MLSELDRARAAGVEYHQGTATTAGDEPLIVDVEPASIPGSHHILESLTFVANLVTRRPDPAVGVVPISNLYLCPPETISESQAEAVAGWQRQARPIPLSACVDSVPIGAGPPFAFSMIWTGGFKAVIPLGWFLRAIVVAAPGTAAPGPGVGSVGTLRALYTREKNVC